MLVINLVFRALIEHHASDRNSHSRRAISSIGRDRSIPRVPRAFHIRILRYFVSFIYPGHPVKNFTVWIPLSSITIINYTNVSKAFSLLTRRM